MGIDQYTCEKCGETFDFGWSDKEAKKESEELFNADKNTEMVIICDECFKFFMKNFN